MTLRQVAFADIERETAVTQFRPSNSIPPMSRSGYSCDSGLRRGRAHPREELTLRIDRDARRRLYRRRLDKHPRPGNRRYARVRGCSEYFTNRTSFPVSL